MSDEHPYKDAVARHLDELQAHFDTLPGKRVELVLLIREPRDNPNEVACDIWSRPGVDVGLAIDDAKYMHEATKRKAS